MKIGILLCAYQCEEHLEAVLAPWAAAKEKYDIIISSVSGLFKEYQGMSFDKDNEKTLNIIESYIENDVIECSFAPLPGKTESEARNLPLKDLLNEGCDFIWLLDGDEYYTIEQIVTIISYIEKKPFIDWFSINFKNYVFDGNVWVDGFCPPRIFRRVTSQGFKLEAFYWDNDVYYKKDDEQKKYNNMSTMIIPKNIAHVRHMTWLSNEKSKRKVQYQNAHFSGVCGYKWNDKEDCLEFNEKYYASMGIPIPKLNSH